LLVEQFQLLKNACKIRRFFVWPELFFRLALLLLNEAPITGVCADRFCTRPARLGGAGGAGAIGLDAVQLKQKKL
jgi:hypothetical protein